MNLTERDIRIADLAIRKGFVSFRRLRESVEEASGVPLLERLVGRGLISRSQAEDLRKEEDESSRPSDGTPEIMDDDRLCEAIIRRGLASFATLRDAIRLRDKYRKGDRQLKSLDEILIEMGYLTARQLRQIRGDSGRVRIALPEKMQSKLGELAVERGYITREQLLDCLETQSREAKGSREPRRVGEIMLAKGYLSAEQLDELLTRHFRPPGGLKIPGYELIAKIGRGGMGEIYKARQMSVDRIVAIKILPKQYAADREYMERFIREARLLARLDHPYIVKAIDAGRYEGTYYYVMEYVAGMTVQERLLRKGVLPERDCLKIGFYVACALEHAAKHGLVHRDIKPSNMIITREGVVKLCDLGIAKLLGESKDTQITQAGYVVGSPLYISPESCLGNAVDIRSDLYSLGASLYHCATGQPPFTAPSSAALLAMHVHETPIPPRLKNPGLSEGFNQVILRLLSKSPDERYAGPTEVMKVFEDLLKGPGNGGSTMRLQSRTRVIYKTRISWGAVAAAIFLTILILGAITTYFLHDAGALHLPFLE